MARTVADVLAGVALAAATGLACPPANAETLNQALASAYKYNPRLDAERARLRATDEEVARANSGYRPVITGTADVNAVNTNIRPDIAAGNNEGTTHPRGYAFTLTQPLFTGFQVTNAVREAEAAVRAGRETLRDTERLILLEAVAAYTDVVRDQAVVRLQENNVQVLSRELKATQDRFSVSEVTRTDVAQAQARRAGSVSALDLARANLKTSRASYERVIGHPPSKLVEAKVPERLLPKSLEEAIAIGARENALVIAALYREQGARHTVERIRGELLPQARLEAKYEDRFDSQHGIDETETTTVTARLTVPIYEGGEVHARVRQAKHTHVSRLQEIKQVRTEVQQAVVAAWSQLQGARGQLQSDTLQVESNRTALAGVREEERVGQRTLLDILNAEQELFSARTELVRAQRDELVTTRRNLVVAAYSVLSTTGKLDSTTLRTASQIYDPEAHYFEVRRKWWGISITDREGHSEKLDLWETHGRRASVK